MELKEIGWNEFFGEQFKMLAMDDLAAARISRTHGTKYLVCCEKGELPAELSGRFQFNAKTSLDYPVTGDWVAIRCPDGDGPAIIHHLFKRKSVFLRKAVDMSSDSQLMLANVDTVFITCGLDRDFNLRRIERYLAMVWESGAEPVILLNKADICSETDSCIQKVESVAMGVQVYAVSAVNNKGFEMLSRHIQQGRTIAFLGSSGVGKSTIINRIIGFDRQRTNTLREKDQKGRHTTTSREMILIPERGILIDTPGMKELQPYADENEITGIFKDIENLSSMCRFRDCRHEQEPGCAVREAIEKGLIDNDRYENYIRLKKEAKYLSEKRDVKAQLLEKAKWKNICKMQKRIKTKGSPF